MAVMASIVENDFYKIGFHTTSPFFLEADSNRIAFYGDIDTTNTKGSIETVRYYTTKDSVSGDSRAFYKLFRLVNTTTGKGTSLGFTTFNLTYYDSTGKKLSATPLNATDRAKIVSVKIEMKLESPVVFNDDKSRLPAASYWEKYISPKNLRRLK